jgi:hypothetical protein
MTLAPALKLLAYSVLALALYAVAHAIYAPVVALAGRLS